MNNGHRLDDGFYVTNESDDITFRMVAYDANKQAIPQQEQPVPPNYTRYIGTSHIGSVDYIYLLLFVDEESFNPPPGIGIIADGHGGGGGGGISIAGFGGSVTASVTVTGAFSQPVAAAMMELRSGKTPSKDPNWPATHRWAKIGVNGGAGATYTLTFRDCFDDEGLQLYGWATDLEWALGIANDFVLGS